jgi:hypothetical protein
MSEFTITRQDGTVESFPMPLSGWLRISIANGGGDRSDGVFSSSEAKKSRSISCRSRRRGSPRLKEVGTTSAPGHGQARRGRSQFRAMAHDDARAATSSAGYDEAEAEAQATSQRTPPDSTATLLNAGQSLPGTC